LTLTDSPDEVRDIILRCTSAPEARVEQEKEALAAARKVYKR